MKATDEEHINTQGKSDTSLDCVSNASVCSVDHVVNKLSQLKANQAQLDLVEEGQSTPISSLPKSVQFLNSPVSDNVPRASTNNNSFMHMDASNLSVEPHQPMDQEDEEVILFKPNPSTNGTASPPKTRLEPIGPEIRSSPGAGSSPSSQQPNNVLPAVPVSSGGIPANNRGPTGWDLFASQAPQQPLNSNAFSPAPLSTQAMGAGQMYTPFGTYGYVCRVVVC